MGTGLLTQTLEVKCMLVSDYPYNLARRWVFTLIVCLVVLSVGSGEPPRCRLEPNSQRKIHSEDSSDVLPDILSEL